MKTTCRYCGASFEKRGNSLGFCPECKLVTLSTLKERGWTDAAVRRWLDQEDAALPNPYYRSVGAPMRLFVLRRVEAVEATPEFRAWFEARSRAAAGQRLVERRERLLWGETARERDERIVARREAQRKTLERLNARAEMVRRRYGLPEGEG
jgi:hypothetical protein